MASFGGCAFKEKLSWTSNSEEAAARATRLGQE